MDEICNTLETHTLGHCEFEKFRAAVDNRELLEPCLLDTLGDYRTPKCRPTKTQEHQDGIDWENILDDRKFPPTIHILINGYKTFDVSEELQREALSAAKSPRFYTRVQRPGSRLVQYEWSPAHTQVATKAIDQLVSEASSAR